MRRNSRGGGLCCLVAAFFIATGALPVGAAEAAGAVGKIFHWRPFLAPFHAVVLHFPIGFLTAAFLLEVYRTVRPSEEVRRITLGALWLSLGAGVISATFGLMRAGSADYDAHALHLHRLFGLGVPVATLVALVLNLAGARAGARAVWLGVYRAALSGTIALVVIAGHLGGNLTHGSRYLTENAPEFVKKLIEEKGAARVLAGDEKMDFYREKVQPIFAAKCYGCHGAEKQKAGYRLDIPSTALAGGKSGSLAIKAGNPLKSHLVELILLPPNHDDIMPPDGKEPLKPEEIMVLIDWIRSGASFGTDGTKLVAGRPAG